MLAAVRSAEKGMRSQDGGPFGACIVRKGKVLAVAHNTVLKNQDPTCHAEINAIRIASRKMKSYALTGCEIFSTTEPCPMCFSAIHWAKIESVFFGTHIKDVQSRGFNELSLSNVRLKKLGKSPVRVTSDVCRRECEMLLRRWDKIPQKRLY